MNMSQNGLSHWRLSLKPWEHDVKLTISYTAELTLTVGVKQRHCQKRKDSENFPAQSCIQKKF